MRDRAEDTSSFLDDFCTFDNGTLRVAGGCAAIPRKALMYRDDITRLELPDSLEEIGEYAFAFTAIEEFVAPASLAHIGSNAFYQCKALRRVTCNDNLKAVDDYAFRESGLESIELSKALNSVGKRILKGTPLARSFTQGRFCIPMENRHYICDEAGGLYRILDDKRSLKGESSQLALKEMMSESVGRHAPLTGTVVIEDDAYRGLESLRQVVLPEGLRRVGIRAFAYCRNLTEVQLSSTVESLDQDAFYLSPLQSLNIPASLAEVGECALVTRSESDTAEGPNLPNLVIDKNCERVFLNSGLLCCKRSDGAVEALVHCGCNNVVVVPEDVDVLGPYALASGVPVDELVIQSRSIRIHKLALPAKRAISVFRVELGEDLCGRNYLELRFPPHIPLNLSYDDMFQRLGAQGNLVVPRAARMSAFPHHSEEEVLARGNQLRVLDLNFVADQSDQALYRMVDQTQRARLIFDRLRHPQFLSQANENRFRASLRRTCEELCVQFAQMAEWDSIEFMLEESLVDSEGFSRAVERVSAAGDASLTGYLLEAKRRYFDIQEVDFEL